MSDKTTTCLLSLMGVCLSLFLVVYLSDILFTADTYCKEITRESDIEILATVASESNFDMSGSFVSEMSRSTDIVTTPVTEPNFDHTEVLEYVTYFDVPLSEDLQDHLFAVCQHYDIDPALVLAVIDRESDFRPKLMGDSGAAYGLMQVQLKWHKDRMLKLGYSDLLDPYANIAVGVDYLAELFGRGKPVEWVLMAYNGGPSYANKKFNKGEVSDYAQKVLENSKNFEMYTVVKE